MKDGGNGGRGAELDGNLCYHRMYSNFVISDTLSHHTAYTDTLQDLYLRLEADT